MITELAGSLLVVILDFFKVMICFQTILGFTLRWKPVRVAIAFVCYTLFLCLSVGQPFFEAVSLITVMPFLFVLLLLHRMRLNVKNFLLLYIVYTVIKQLDTFILCLSDLASPVSNEQLRNFLAALISFLLFYILCFYCRARQIQVTKEDDTLFIMTQIFFTVVTGALTSATGYLLRQTENIFLQDALYFSVSALSVIVSLNGFLLFFLLQANRRYRQIQALQDQLYHAQQDYVAQVLSQDTILRGFRHDIRGHLISLRSYLEDQDTRKALRYMDEMDNALSASRLKYHTQNTIADALLNAKAKELEEHHISCTVSGSLPDKLPLTDFDLCLLISNLLNNALEANLRLPEDTEKFIRFELAYLPTCFSLRVSNPIQEISDLKTKKQEKENHGIGLKNIAACADRYHGTCEIIQKDLLFTVEIIIPETFPAPGESEETI